MSVTVFEDKGLSGWITRRFDVTNDSGEHMNVVVDLKDERQLRLTVVSTFGNFSHHWTALPGGIERLADLNFDYFMGKVAPGQQRVFSWKKTFEAIVEDIRDYGYDTDEEESKILDLGNCCSIGCSAETFLSWMQEQHDVDDYWHMIGEEINPWHQNFWDTLWVPFVETLK
jgi:hypothetical protein